MEPHLKNLLDIETTFDSVIKKSTREKEHLKKNLEKLLKFQAATKKVEGLEQDCFEGVTGLIVIIKIEIDSANRMIKQSNETKRVMILKYFRTRLFGVDFCKQLTEMAAKYEFDPHEHQLDREARISEHVNFFWGINQEHQDDIKKLHDAQQPLLYQKRYLEFHRCNLIMINSPSLDFDLGTVDAQLRNLTENVQRLQSQIDILLCTMRMTGTCYSDRFISPSDKTEMLRRLGFPQSTPEESSIVDRLERPSSKKSSSTETSIEPESPINHHEAMFDIKDAYLEPEQTIQNQAVVEPMPIVVDQLSPEPEEQEDEDEYINVVDIDDETLPAVEEQETYNLIENANIQAHSANLIDVKTTPDSLEPVLNERYQSTVSLQTASVMHLINSVYQSIIQVHSQPYKTVVEPMSVDEDQPTLEMEEQVDVEQVIGGENVNSVAHDEDQPNPVSPSADLKMLLVKENELNEAEPGIEESIDGDVDTIEEQLTNDNSEKAVVHDETRSSTEMDLDVSNEIVEKRNTLQEYINVSMDNADVRAFLAKLIDDKQKPGIGFKQLSEPVEDQPVLKPEEQVDEQLCDNVVEEIIGGENANAVAHDEKLEVITVAQTTDILLVKEELNETDTEIDDTVHGDADMHDDTISIREMDLDVSNVIKQKAVDVVQQVLGHVNVDAVANDKDEPLQVSPQFEDVPVSPSTDLKILPIEEVSGMLEELNQDNSEKMENVLSLKRPATEHSASAANEIEPKKPRLHQPMSVLEPEERVQEPVEGVIGGDEVDEVMPILESEEPVKENISGIVIEEGEHFGGDEVDEIMPVLMAEEPVPEQVHAYVIGLDQTIQMTEEQKDARITRRSTRRKTKKQLYGNPILY